MQLHCPHCGQACETEQELALGQHVLCPFCNSKFAYRPSPVRQKLPARKIQEAQRGKAMKLFWDKLTRVQKWMLIGFAAVILATILCIKGMSGARKESQEVILKNAIAKVENLKREQYLKKKAWYNHQLDYNDLKEWVFNYTKDVVYLYLSSMNGQEVKITYLPEAGFLEYSPSIAKGYAQELIFARMFIENFEHPERLKEDEDKDNSMPEVISDPCDDDITIKKGKTLTVKSTVSGELTVERGGVLKLVGSSTGKIFVADGGRLELSGTSTGNINNKGTTIANGKIAGTLYNHGRLEIYGTVTGKVTSYAWGKCMVDKAATVTGNGKIVYEK